MRRPVSDSQRGLLEPQVSGQVFVAPRPVFRHGPEGTVRCIVQDRLVHETEAVLDAILELAPELTAALLAELGEPGIRCCLLHENQRTGCPGSAQGPSGTRSTGLRTGGCFEEIPGTGEGEVR